MIFLSFHISLSLCYFLGPLDTDVFRSFASKRSPITADVEGRVEVIRTEEEESELCRGVSAAGVTAAAASWSLMAVSVLAMLT